MSRYAIRSQPASVLIGSGASSVRSTNNCSITGNSATTIGALAYLPAAGTAFSGVISFGTLTVGQAYYLGTDASNGFGLGIYGAFYSSGRTFPVGRWARVITSWDGVNTIRYYIDGVLISTYVAALTPNIVAGKIHVGNVIGGSFPFLGKIREAFVYNRVLSDVEVSTVELNGVYPSSGLEALYKCDENTGTTVADSSVNANTGTFVGTVSWASGPVSSRTAVAQQQNLVYPSEVFTGWNMVGTTIGASIEGPYVGMTATGMVESTASTSHNFFQVYTNTVGKLHTESIMAKKGDRSWLLLAPDSAAPKVWFNLDTGVLGSTAGGATGKIEALPNGFYRCSITFTAGLVQGVLRAYATTADTVQTYVGTVGLNAIYVVGAQAVTSNWEGPYKKTTASAYNVGNIRHIVPQRQNLLAYSEDITQASAWNLSNLATPTFTTDYLGNNTAQFVRDNAVAGVHQFWEAYSNIQNAVYTRSLDIKAVGSNWVWLGENNGTSYTYFDPTNGVFGITSANLLNRQVRSLGNGFWRVAITFVGTNGTQSRFTVASGGDGSAISYTGDGSKGFIVARNQLTRGEFDWRYTKTTTAAINTGNMRDLARPRGIADGVVPSIQGLNAWYRADVVELTSSLVSSVIDLSGKGNTLIQPTAAYRPSVVMSAAFNNKPVLRSDGTRSIGNTTRNVFPADACTIFAVVASSSSGTSGQWFAEVHGGGSLRWHFYGASETEFQRWNSATCEQTLTSQTAAIITYTASGVNETMYKNSGGAATSASRPGNTNRNLILFASNLSSSFPRACDIAEIIIFDRILSAGEIASVNSYLSTRYNITLTP